MSLKTISMLECLEELRDLTSQTVSCDWRFIVDKDGFFRVTFSRYGKSIHFKSKDDPELCFRNAVNYIKENRKPLEHEVGFKL